MSFLGPLVPLLSCKHTERQAATAEFGNLFGTHFGASAEAANTSVWGPAADA